MKRSSGTHGISKNIFIKGLNQLSLHDQASDKPVYQGTQYYQIHFMVKRPWTPDHHTQTGCHLNWKHTVVQDVTVELHWHQKARTGSSKVSVA